MNVLDLPIACILAPNSSTKLLTNCNSGVFSTIFTQLAARYNLDRDWALWLCLGDPLQKLGIFLKFLK
jgi:hypothetical protein